MKARFALFLLFAILSLKLSVVFAQENIFTVWQPDYQKSPYTGIIANLFGEMVIVYYFESDELCNIIRC